MFSNIRNRLIFIGILVLAALYGLWPREVIRSIRLEDGTTRDTVVKEWNLKYGLDLQGGMHLALEIDQSGRAHRSSRSPGHDYPLGSVEA